MKILLTGATQNIGSKVLEILLRNQHDVWVLIEDPTRLEEFQHKGVHAMIGDPRENGSWLSQLPGQLDAILNLTMPQTPSRLALKQVEEKYAPDLFNGVKNLLYAGTKTKATRLYQIADIHAYVNNGSDITEKTPFNRDSTDWGRVYMDMIPYLQSQKQLPITLLMHGLLYDSAGTTYPSYPKVGGQLPVIGSGEDTMQLTHIDDLASATVFTFEKNTDLPALNIVDDHPITIKEFTKLLALRTNSGTVPLPKFLAGPLIGEVFTNTYTTSTHVHNDELKSLGYWLKFPDIKAGFAQGIT